MRRDNYIQKKEAETFKKLNAFQLYKELGMETAIQTYSNLKDFLIIHKDKSYSELEQELLAQLSRSKEMVH